MRSREDSRNDEWLDQVRAERLLPKCSRCGRKIRDGISYRMDCTTLLCQDCFDEWTEEIKEVAPYDMGRD